MVKRRRNTLLGHSLKDESLAGTILGGMVEGCRRKGRQRWEYVKQIIDDVDYGGYCEMKKLATNNKLLSLLISSILQTASVKIWAKSIHWLTSYSVWKQPTSEFFAKMEKSGFRVLIKHHFCVEEPYRKLRLNTINIIRTLLRWME